MAGQLFYGGVVTSPRQYFPLKRKKKESHRITFLVSQAKSPYFFNFPKKEVLWKSRGKLLKKKDKTEIKKYLLKKKKIPDYGTDMQT